MALLDALSRAKAAILNGLQRPGMLDDHLRAAGVSTDLLSRLVDAESASRERLEIRPWQSLTTIKARISSFDRKACLASRRRQAILSLLAGKEDRPSGQLRMIEDGTDGSSQKMVETYGLERLARDAQLRLLDANADAAPEITDRLAPGALFVAIQSPPVADIVQISDRTLSNSLLLDPVEGPHRRAAVLEIVRRKVAKARGQGVLVVATRAVLMSLHVGISVTLSNLPLTTPSDGLWSMPTPAGSAPACRA